MNLLLPWSFTYNYTNSLLQIYLENMEVNGVRQLSGYQHSSKYLAMFIRREKFIQLAGE